jgi:hypothetical protein
MASADRYAEVLTDACRCGPLNNSLIQGWGRTRSAPSPLISLISKLGARPRPGARSRGLQIRNSSRSSLPTTCGTPIRGPSVRLMACPTPLPKTSGIVRSSRSEGLMLQRLSPDGSPTGRPGTSGKALPPFDHPGIRKALRLAMKASAREPQRKSRKRVTRDIFDRLLATCSGSKAIDLRDWAILVIAFAAGGRRSEVATLRHSQISAADPIKLRSADPTLPTAPYVRIALGRTKTTTAGQGAFVFAAGRAAIALHEWMQAANISSGPIFRKIRKDSSIGANPPPPQSVSLILQEALPDGGAGPGRVQGPRTAAGLHDTSRTRRDPAGGRDAPIRS